MTGADRAIRYATALRALCVDTIAQYDAGTGYESSSELNTELEEAGRGLRRWQRKLIDRRLLRELDYWNRTGGNG